MIFFIPSSRGQSFAVLELLVASIMTLALLAVIVGLIYYFDSLATQASFRAFKDAVVSGVNSPNGDVIRVEDVVLPESIFTTTAISNMAAIPSECVSLQAAGGDDLIPRPDSINPTGVEVRKRLRTTIYVQCVLGFALSPVSSECAKSCLVSFGKPLAIEP